MAVAWCYGTGCGDNFLTGFHDLMPTRRDILLIKKHLREEVGLPTTQISGRSQV